VAAGEFELGSGEHQGAIGQAVAAVGVKDLARLGGAGGRIHAPLQGGGVDEHLASHGAGLTQGVVVARDADAAAGHLVAVGGIGGGLFDHLDSLPRHIQLFGQQHGDGGAHALAHLGAEGGDGDDAILVYFEVDVGLEGGFGNSAGFRGFTRGGGSGRWGECGLGWSGESGCGGFVAAAEVDAEDEASGGGAHELEEGAAGEGRPRTDRLEWERGGAGGSGGAGTSQASWGL
jgi:hypothetical protein